MGPGPYNGPPLQHVPNRRSAQAPRDQVYAKARDAERSAEHDAATTHKDEQQHAVAEKLCLRLLKELVRPERQAREDARSIERWDWQ